MPQTGFCREKILTVFKRQAWHLVEPPLVLPEKYNKKPPCIEKILSFVVINHDTGCWEWNGNRNKNGYGVICEGPYVFPAHRASWLAHNGPIPDGLLACHHCDNPPCVNPDHLFIGTHKDNSDDKYAKGRQGRCGRMRALTQEAIAEIRTGEKSRKNLAKKYGVAVATIARYDLRRKSGRPRKNLHGE